MVQFLRVKNLAYCEFNRLSAFLPAWEISRERRLCLNVRSTQKCHTEDHQSSWPDSGKLLRHQYGISVVESCETSQAARRREGCIRRLHSFRALRVKPDRKPVVISCLPKVDHVIKSCNSSLSLFVPEDKETEKLETSLSFVQHGVAHGAQFWKCLQLYSGFGK